MSDTLTLHRPLKQRKHALHFHKSSRTKQSFRQESDINVIMSRFEKTGLLTHVNQYNGQYGDFTGLPEYQEAMNKVVSANEMFASLPAKIRDRFANDPAKFLSFVGDPANAAEAKALGLFKAVDEAPARLSNPTPEPKAPKEEPKGSDNVKPS